MAWREKPTKEDSWAYEIDSLSMVNAKLDTLTKKLERLNFAGHTSQVLCCEIYGAGHSIVECQNTNPYSQGCSIEQLNALNNYNGRPQGNSYSNTYNPRWRNHPNFL